MKSLSVAEDFDVVEDGFSIGILSLVIFMVDAFGFQGVEKTLAVAVRGILVASVSMPESAFFGFSFPNCHDQCLID
jgi:hypothetical protein